MGAQASDGQFVAPPAVGMETSPAQAGDIRNEKRHDVALHSASWGSGVRVESRTEQALHSDGHIAIDPIAERSSRGASLVVDPSMRRTRMAGAVWCQTQER